MYKLHELNNKIKCTHGATVARLFILIIDAATYARVHTTTTLFEHDTTLFTARLMAHQFALLLLLTSGNRQLMAARINTPVFADCV